MNTTTVSLLFKGQQIVVLETKSWIYSVDARLNLKGRARYGRIRPKFKPKINWKLKIPLSSLGSYKATTTCDNIEIFAIVVGLSIDPLSFEVS